MFVGMEQIKSQFIINTHFSHNIIPLLYIRHARPFRTGTHLINYLNLIPQELPAAAPGIRDHAGKGALFRKRP
jgi:hypothetical protein